MPSKPDRVTEYEVSIAVARVLAAKPSGECSISELVLHAPDHLSLSDEDRQISKTRPNEALWEQQVRNITSHHAAEGNFICEGYLERIPGGLKITDAGKQYLKSKGYLV